MNKIKVLWISDLVAPTGFSRVSHSIIKYLDQEKYDIWGLGVNYFGDPHPYKDIKIFPASSRGDIYGINRLKDIIKLISPDLIFILNDAWILTKFLEEIKNIYLEKPLPKIVTYFPVDASEHDPIWYKHFDIVSKAVAYTEFGKRVVNKAVPTLDLEIIPHGIDTSVFYKSFPTREDAKIAISDKLKDTFIFLNANRNQPRKKLDITLEAFKLFSEGKPENVKLYLHCGVVDNSLNISRLAKRLEIDKRLILTNLNKGVQALPEEKLNVIYNATDVGINTSLGEGFGLTSIEHAITGAPQIVPDHSACKEIYSDCGLLVPTTMKWTLDDIMTVGELVRPEDVAKSMELIYTDKELYDKLSKASIDKFSEEKYQWSNISEQWSNLFMECLNGNNISV